MGNIYCFTRIVTSTASPTATTVTDVFQYLPLPLQPAVMRRHTSETQQTSPNRSKHVGVALTQTARPSTPPHIVHRLRKLSPTSLTASSSHQHIPRAVRRGTAISLVPLLRSPSNRFLHLLYTHRTRAIQSIQYLRMVGFVNNSVFTQLALTRPRDRVSLMFYH